MQKLVCENLVCFAGWFVALLGFVLLSVSLFPRLSLALELACTLREEPNSFVVEHRLISIRSKLVTESEAMHRTCLRVLAVLQSMLSHACVFTSAVTCFLTPSREYCGIPPSTLTYRRICTYIRSATLSPIHMLTRAWFFAIDTHVHHTRT